MNDRVQLYLDTSGPGLHKRGYRANGNDAPLRETLAAAMITLAHYRGREFLWDGFCGSGTIPIEAALIARNQAPGMYRRFSAEAFPWVEPKIWGDVRTEMRDKEFKGNYRILGSDNDPKCVSLSMANAKKAGVDRLITFRDGDATKMSLPSDAGIFISNPPYGQRMLEQQSAQRLYAALGRHLKFADGWKNTSSPASRNSSTTSASVPTKAKALQRHDQVRLLHVLRESEEIRQSTDRETKNYEASIYHQPSCGEQRPYHGVFQRHPHRLRSPAAEI